MSARACFVTRFVRLPASASTLTSRQIGTAAHPALSHEIDRRTGKKGAQRYCINDMLDECYKGPKEDAYFDEEMPYPLDWFTYLCDKWEEDRPPATLPTELWLLSREELGQWEEVYYDPNEAFDTARDLTQYIPSMARFRHIEVCDPPGKECDRQAHWVDWNYECDQADKPECKVPEPVAETHSSGAKRAHGGSAGDEPKTKAARSM